MFEGLVALALTTSDPQERAAITKATEATVVYLGVGDEILKAKSNAETYARRLAEQYGVSEEIAVFLVGLQTYRTQSATVRLTRSSILTVSTQATSVTFTF